MYNFMKNPLAFVFQKRNVSLPRLSEKFCVTITFKINKLRNLEINHDFHNVGGKHLFPGNALR